MNDSLLLELWELRRHALENRFIHLSSIITSEFSNFGNSTCDVDELLRRIDHMLKVLERIRRFCGKGEFREGNK